jgi:hypothetical protein
MELKSTATPALGRNDDAMNYGPVAPAAPGKGPLS